MKENNPGEIENDPEIQQMVEDIGGLMDEYREGVTTGRYPGISLKDTLHKDET